MRLVKFINAHPDYRDMPVYINVDQIVSVFEKAATQGGSLQTQIFGAGQTWTVEESLNEVVRIVNADLMLTE